MLPLDNLPGECRTESPTYLERDALAVDAGGFRSDRSGRHLSPPNFGTANAAEGTGSVFFWRDRTREVDFVADTGGRLELFEAKWTELSAIQ
jgi:hypothetical protein